LKEEAMADRLDLHFLDESGFAPTLPTTYTWARVKARPIVPYEAPQGRRVNVLGALAPFGSRPRFAYTSRTGKLDSTAFLAFVWHDVGGMATPLGDVPAGFRRARRCVIVLDNYSVHHSRVVQDALPGLAAAGIELVYLPPYSPELNLIEGLWRHVKHEDLPVRSYATAQALQAAVDQALDQHAYTLAHPVSHSAEELPEAA
jgi:DDE superfamily endonuclease